MDEAHLVGRRVLCHAIGGPGQRMAVEVGVESIDHGCYLDQDPELLPLIRDKGIFYVPTFSVFTHHAEMDSPGGRYWANDFRQNHARSLQLARDAGVMIPAGTDEGGWQHGNNAREISLLVEKGLTPMEGIVAATGNTPGAWASATTSAPSKRARPPT